MDMFFLIAEDRIKKAYEDGQFKDLPGMGKEMKLDDLSHIPEELRMAYRLLKNAGMMDEETELKKELMTIQDLLKYCHDEKEREALHRKLTEKQLKLERLANKRNLFNSPASAFYKQKVYEKLHSSDFQSGR